MESTEGNKNVSLSLSDDEALVLFARLSKFNEEEHPSLFQDQANVFFGILKLCWRKLYQQHLIKTT